MRAEAATKGLYALPLMWNSGMLQIGSNTHPIQNPDDLRGFKVREAASEARRPEGELPPVLRGRPIALRAFDATGMLVGAELALNDDVAAAIGRQFANPEAAHLHAHNAAHGCFAARIDRA